MAQISLAGSKGALRGWRGRVRERGMGGGGLGGGCEEHKDRGRLTVKQMSKLWSALSDLWKLESLHQSASTTKSVFRLFRSPISVCELLIFC